MPTETARMEMGPSGKCVNAAPTAPSENDGAQVTSYNHSLLLPML